MIRVWVLIAVIFALLILPKTNAQINQDEKKLILFGDIRLRSEFDRNSRRVDGSLRDDRDRLRYRLRFGLNYNLNKNIEFGGRIRSGNPKNQQSPQVTFGDDSEEREVSIDKAYIKFKTDNNLWIWAGKNFMPIWKQNELLWDNDVNPEGIAAGGNIELNKNSKLTPIIGYFIVNHSNKNFDYDSSLFINQIKLYNKLGENELFISSGIINGKNIPDQPNGAHSFFLDYNIWVSSLQFNLKSSNLIIGLDYLKNLANYKNSIYIDNIFENQTNGFIGNLTFSKNKLLMGYYYAHIQKYAVIDYFAQDDWVRWGNNHYTRASNFSGHEFKVKYNFKENFNTVIRFYSVKGIKTNDINLETGMRLRIDVNISI